MSDDVPATNLYQALLNAQRAMGPVLKNAVNPHLRSKYADLGSVIDTIEQPLWDNGLLLVQRFTHDQGGAILVTELIHAASGERLTSEVPVVSKDPTDPQKIGAAITYYRRYSLLALLGLAPEDDDGHAASQPRREREYPPQGRTLDEALSSGISPVERRTPAPRPAPPAAAPPAAPPPYSADEWDELADKAWEMAENQRPLAEIKDYLNKHRHRMTPAQMKDTREAIEKIEQQHYAPARIAG